jgi:hypothetical protein
VEDLAHVDAAGYKVVAGGVDVVQRRGQGCTPSRAWPT